MSGEPFASSAYPKKHPYGDRTEIGKHNSLARDDIGVKEQPKHMQYYLDHPKELLRVYREQFQSQEARTQYALHVMQNGEPVCTYLVRYDGNVMEIINVDDIPEDKEKGMGARDERFYYFDENGNLIDTKNQEYARTPNPEQRRKKRRNR